jgi:hypothetical protein
MDNIIVSMTSWSKRIDDVSAVVKGLLVNTVVPYKIVLNLSEEEFVNKENDLPEELLSLREGGIFEIFWVEENVKQFKKLMPTFERYPNDIIISVDDDYEYPNDFIETLYRDYTNNGRRNPITYSVFLEDNGYYKGYPSHHGCFTITESKFYKRFLKEIYNGYVLPRFRSGKKCFDDPLYTMAAFLNGYHYKIGSCNYNKKRLEEHENTHDSISKRGRTYRSEIREYKEGMNDFVREYLTNNVKTVVSFTSFKDRLKVVPLVIDSLLKQTLKPYKIILVVDEFEKNILTENITHYVDSGDIEIIYAEDDIKPHKKYYYAMQKYPDCCVITVDDDIIYSTDLVSSLFESYVNYPDCVSARRVHLMVYNNDGKVSRYKRWKHSHTKVLEPSENLFPTGCGGILYPPSIFDISPKCLSEIDESLFADDVYLKYLAIKKGVKAVWVSNQKQIGEYQIEDYETQKNALRNLNVLSNRNDDYINLFFNKKLKLRKKEDGLRPVMPKYTPNKNVVYTCITGNYDSLSEPYEISDNFDYICFTDDTSLTSKVWTIMPIPDELKDLSDVRKQRSIKINAHKYLSKYDLSIWVDANVDVRGDLNDFISTYCNDDSVVYIPEHPVRKCIYQEAIACEIGKKDSKEVMSTQMEKYKTEGYPKKNGLVQSNIMVRKHNDESCIKLMEDWWKEIEENSYRDQLSFNYVLWKNSENVTFTYLPKDICKSKYFKWRAFHLPKITSFVNCETLTNSDKLEKTEKLHLSEIKTIDSLLGSIYDKKDVSNKLIPIVRKINKPNKIKLHIR